jgi:hypothetical protein
MNHSLTANIGHFGSIVTALFIYLFEGLMLSRWKVTNIRLLPLAELCIAGDQLVICGLYLALSISSAVVRNELVISVHRGALVLGRERSWQ